MRSAFYLFIYFYLLYVTVTVTFRIALGVDNSKLSKTKHSTNLSISVASIG